MASGFHGFRQFFRALMDRTRIYPKCITLFPILTLFTFSMSGQTDPYFSFYISELQRLDVDHNLCNYCVNNEIGYAGPNDGESTFGPNGMIYVFDQHGPIYNTDYFRIYEVDPVTAQSTLYFDGPSGLRRFHGFVSVGNGIFYLATENWPWWNIFSDSLYRCDVNAGTVEMIGTTGKSSWGALTISEGEIYGVAFNLGDNGASILKIDTINPGNSEVVMMYSLEEYRVHSITASPNSQVLMGRDFVDGSDPDWLVTVNLIDGTIERVCQLPNGYPDLTSPLEHNLNLNTEIYLDLDCDDSSGATGSDYNGDPFDCLKEEGVGIADIDVRMTIDAYISNMTIDLIPPLPDAPYEILDMSGQMPGITSTGLGTSAILLTNDGIASVRDFTDALHMVVYKDKALLPQGGMRTVQVQFTTVSGGMSNIAEAYIEVEELPLLALDLGDDVDICDGETNTFDAGVSNADYLWSTDAITQAITVSEPGLYSVTVSDGVHCPNRDTVELVVLPVASVWLEGDTEVCDNEDASLTIQTNVSFPLEVEISTGIGENEVHTNVLNGYTFQVTLDESTQFTIAGVNSIVQACYDIQDADQIISLYSTYVIESGDHICPGDSVDVGGTWVFEAGVFSEELATVNGCDSILITTVTMEETDSILITGTSCDSNEIGVFTAYLDNPNGCDTLMLTTITAGPADSTYLFGSSCRSTEAGVFEDHLSNVAGCDSVVITEIVLEGDIDTTHIIQMTCDTTETGVLESLYTNVAGCDSLVIATISLAPPDTMMVFRTSCDSSKLGLFEDVFVNTEGCDSIVLTTVTFSENDSTWQNSATCDPGETGMFVESFVSQAGCDSIVTIMVELLPSDSLALTATTCDPDEAGIDVANFVNQYGCDSVVTTETELLPMPELEIKSTTCDLSEMGVFTSILPGTESCDTLLTETVTLQAPDTTFIELTTCDADSAGLEEFMFVNAEGCDSIVLLYTELLPQPGLEFIPMSEYNGYDISCAGESDGSLLADPAGVGPFTFQWSNGGASAENIALEAGVYGVTITDANGCSAEEEIVLFEPPEVTMSLEITEPDCFSQLQGEVTVSLLGGVEPYRYSLNGGAYQAEPIFTSLGEGTYTLTAIDANDCSVAEIVWINVPLRPGVDLGEDLEIDLGEIATLQAIVNVPFDSLVNITWSGQDDGFDCPDCLSQPVAPIVTTTYTITVKSVEGCQDEDALTVYVDPGLQVYAPNVFSPNGDGINDWWGIFGPDTETMTETKLHIFNRWGGVVFLTENFSVPGHLWDGTTRYDRQASPDVYVWVLKFMDEDGQFQRLLGDLTLVR